MEAATASGVRYNKESKSLYGSIELVGGQQFQNCELFPYYLEDT